MALVPTGNVNSTHQRTMKELQAKPPGLFGIEVVDPVEHCSGRSAASGEATPSVAVTEEPRSSFSLNIPQPSDQPWR